MQSHNPISPHSPWRPLAAAQHAARPMSSFERAHRFQADMERRQARDRRAALAAAVEYTTACIVEYYPEESSSSSGGSNNNNNNKNSKDRRPSFLGWFPPADASNVANPPDECLQFRVGMDLDTSRVKRFGIGDDGYYDEDDDEEEEDDDGWDDCDIDDDLDNIKCPAPLLWLRFPLAVIPPAGAPAASSRSQPAAAAAVDMEAVHLVMPAHVFLPKRLGASASASAAATKPLTTAPLSSSTKPPPTAATAPSSTKPPTGASTTRDGHPRRNNPSSNSSSTTTSSSTPSDNDDPPPGPSITLTRYTTAHLRSPARTWQPPPYIGAAAHAAGIPLHSLCYIDVALHPSRRTGPLAFVPARWMQV
ncbi:hypothetical protein UCDDS831_g07538 [Diplodia seriata]|uniref:Uncharacterized protein n=1 Tax=Diplodia seriata TaxID=420778 RepID=A0A0G2FUJ8_9PEZI|nr:hypothetical protein UCDDS831_g07538 [Diplodia seriata]